MAVHRHRLLVPLTAAVCLTALSPAERKEGITVVVTSPTTEPVQVDIVGNIMVNSPLRFGLTRYYPERPFHAATPIQFMPFVADIPLTLRARGKRPVHVVVDNVITREHLTFDGLAMQLSSKGGRLHLESQPGHP